MLLLDICYSNTLTQIIFLLLLTLTFSFHDRAFSKYNLFKKPIEIGLNRMGGIELRTVLGAKSCQSLTGWIMFLFTGKAVME